MCPHMGCRGKTARLCAREQKQTTHSLTSASEGCRARPRHDEQMPMEWACSGEGAVGGRPALAAAGRGTKRTQRRRVRGRLQLWLLGHVVAGVLSKAKQSRAEQRLGCEAVRCAVVPALRC